MGDQVFVWDGVKEPEENGAPPPTFNWLDPNYETTTTVPESTTTVPESTTTVPDTTTAPNTTAAPTTAAPTTRRDHRRPRRHSSTTTTTSLDVVDARRPRHDHDLRSLTGPLRAGERRSVRSGRWTPLTLRRSTTTSSGSSTRTSPSSISTSPRSRRSSVCRSRFRPIPTGKSARCVGAPSRSRSCSSTAARRTRTRGTRWCWRSDVLRLRSTSPATGIRAGATDGAYTPSNLADDIAVIVSRTRTGGPASSSACHSAG